MANTTAVYARIDSGLKENAEAILQQLGITPSCAIQMLYSQIVLTRGMPLDLHLPPKNLDLAQMTPAELDAALEKDMDDVRAGRTVPLDEAFAEIHNEI